MSNKKNSKSWIWIAAIVGAAGSVLAYGRGPGKWFSDDATVAIVGAVVRRGPLAIRVIERGNLKAADFVSIKNELEGSSTILSLVKEGVVVKEGTLVCELDATNQIEKRVQQEIAVRNADAAFVKSTQTYKIQQSQNESDIALAQQKLSFAEQDLKKYLEGDMVLSKSKAEQAITLQEEEFKRAANKLDWSEKLSGKGFLTATELEADTLAKNRSEVLLDQAKKERALLVDYQVERDSEKLKADLAEATRGLDRVELQAKARLVDFESDMVTNEAKLKIEKEKLAKLDNQILKAKIYAPKAGMVIYAKQDEGGRGMGQSQPIQEGTQVRERQELITIPTAGGMLGTVSLHESVLKQIHSGLLCDVRVDALPKQQFHGSVDSVAVLPDQNSWFANPNTRLYTTMVKIFDGVEEMRPGMSCSVEIRVEDVADAIFVPVQAVFRHLGKNICFVDKGEGKFDVVTVTTDRFNDSHVQITDGLNEGQVVLLSPPASFPIQAGATQEDKGAPGAGGAQRPAGPMNASNARGNPAAPAEAVADERMQRGQRGGGADNAGGGPGGGKNFGGGQGRGGRGAGHGQRPPDSGAPGGNDGSDASKSAEKGDGGGNESSKESSSDASPKVEKQDPVKPGGHR